MMGTPADAGVVPRAIQALFERIDAAQDRWVMAAAAQQQ
jgi:hypothetical protein